MIAWCQSTVNQSRSEAAIVGPTPSTAARASTLAASIASTEPNSPASARAAVGPTWRMDSATRIRHSGLVRACSRLASSRVALALSVPCLTTKNGQVRSCSSVSENTSPSSVTRPQSRSAATASQPSTSMSKAPRPARWNSRSRSWAGQDLVFGQRQSTSSSSLARVVPQAGQTAGNVNSRSWP